MIRRFTVNALITPNVLGVETSFEGLVKFGGNLWIRLSLVPSK